MAVIVARTLMANGLSWTRVRVPRILSTIFKVVYASSAGMMTIAALTETSAGSFGVLGFIALALNMLGSLGYILLIVSFILSMTESWQLGDVEINDLGLVIRAQKKTARPIPRSEIVGAMVVERPMGPQMNVVAVELELKSGDRCVIRLSDPHTAHMLVNDLGFGPRQKRSRTRLAQPSRRLFNLLTGIILYLVMTALTTLAMVVGSSDFSFGVMRLLGQSIGPIIILLLYVLISKRLRGPEAVIGDDGVVVERGVSKKFSRADDPALARAMSGSAVDRWRVASALRNALARSTAQATESSVFQRNGRSIADWRRDLASMLDQRGGYRTNATTIEDANAVLHSPKATADERVGAALALRALGEPPEKVRVAAAATANDQVRVALDAVVDGAMDADVLVERALKRASR